MTGERWRLGRRRLGRVLLGATLALVLAGAVVAVVGDERERDAAGESGTALVAPASPARGEGSAGGPSAPAPNVARGAAADSALPSSPDPSSPTPSGTLGKVYPAGPKIVRTGELGVRVEKDRFTAAFDRVTSIAAAHGGFVMSSSILTQDEDGKRTSSRPQAGEVVLRIPADRFDAARQALSELGTVERASLRGEDVGGQLVDYEARLRSLNAQEEALRTLMGRATAVADVIQVQSSLFEVRQQIEQLQAQRDQLSQAVALSTLHVSLFEPGAVLVPDPDPVGDLARSFERAADGALAVIGGMIVVIGWLAPLAALALLLWGAGRLRRRRPQPTAPAPAAS